MNEREVSARVAELCAARGEPGADPAAQVEAALFLEDVFGVRLGDGDMTEARVGTADRMVRLVLERLGAGGA